MEEEQEHEQEQEQEQKQEQDKEQEQEQEQEQAQDWEHEKEQECHTRMLIVWMDIVDRWMILMDTVSQYWTNDKRFLFNLQSQNQTFQDIKWSVFVKITIKGMC